MTDTKNVQFFRGGNIMDVIHCLMFQLLILWNMYAGMRKYLVWNILYVYKNILMKSLQTKVRYLTAKSGFHSKYILLGNNSTFTMHFSQCLSQNIRQCQELTY